MPRRRKTWPSEKAVERSASGQELSPGELLIPQYSKPTLPEWALESAFKALLGRDNRKIPPARTERLLEVLQDFVLLIDALEAEGIEVTQAMKDQWVAWCTRDALTIRPPAHPRHILALHSTRVDMFLQSKGWPIQTDEKQTRYKSALTQHLPTLLAELANCQRCNSVCPGRLSPDADDVGAFAALTSPAALRDAIVAFHHGIAPDSMRGARVGRRFRRHRKK